MPHPCPSFRYIQTQTYYLSAKINLEMFDCWNVNILIFSKCDQEITDEKLISLNAKYLIELIQVKFLFLELSCQAFLFTAIRKSHLKVHFFAVPLSLANSTIHTFVQVINRYNNLM